MYYCLDVWFFITFEMLLSVTALLLLLYMEYLVYKKKGKKKLKTSLWLSWLRNSGAERRLPVPSVSAVTVCVYIPVILFHNFISTFL